MATAVLITIVISEIAIAFYCLYSKSDQAKTRNITRITVFFVFLILAMTSIIEWNYRWYAVATFLLILALLGAITLLQKRYSTKEYKPGRIVRNAASTVFLAAFTLTPALIFPQHTPLQPTGKYEVETVVYTYTDLHRVETYSDAKENRKVTVQYWYPQDAGGTFPLILFSHGSFGIKSSNVSLYNELASHGYVVCSIDHTYQSLYSRDLDGNQTFLDGGFMREVASEDAKTDRQQSYEFYQKWMDVRAGDINFVIDLILAETQDASSDLVYRLVDSSKMGVMGHSLGGSAALAVGRMRKDIRAVMALEAPFMSDIVGVENGAFIWNDETYPIPILNFYSDGSWSHLEEWPQYAANAKLLTDEDASAYHVYLQGAGHLTLTDLALTSPFLTRILNNQKSSIDARYCLSTINHITLEFFDCYLKGIGEFSPQERY